MSVDVQKDNLPPPRVTTVMNIGRGRATGTRSRKKDRLQQIEHMLQNIVEQRGEEEGVSVLVEQGVGRNKGRKRGASQ
jgi:hypothetical protein